MVGNSLTVGLNRAGLPQFCGPENLADIVRASILGNLSEQQFRQLLVEAYSASLKPDEGRYPRFRLFAGIDDENNWGDYLVAKFKEPLLLSSDELCKLAPAFPSQYHSINVVSIGGELRLAGVLSFDYFHKHFMLDRSEFWLVGGRPAGAMIAVDGPGELRVGGSGVHLRLRAGTIDELLSVSSTPAMRFCHTLGQAVWNSLAAKGTPQAGTNNLGSLFIWIFQEILSFTSAMRHGGTFIILPPTGWQDWIKFRYSTIDLDLASIVKEYAEAALKAGTSKAINDVRDRLVLQDKLFLKVRTVATMGTTDGCVGISENGEIIGFGGEILTNQQTANDSPLKFLNIIDKRPWLNQSDEQFGGQRHRSAYRLCKTVPGATAFVVSQDGYLTAMHSDANGVYVFRKLVPAIPTDI